jgi:acyl phosphate:glycerol-3-phosphate acyltransferase
MFPVWLGFSGGKGVATGLGLLLAAAWPVGIAACLIWLAAARLSKFSSAGALAAFALAPLIALAVAPWPVAVFALAVALPVFLRHRGNIARLRAGTEPRIGKRA